MKTAYLVLQNGTVFKGVSMGKESKAIGEVVFQTSMVGYQEILTDPANEGLMIAQTFPLIGNYGINKFCNESDKCYPSGYIVREICDEPSNFRSEGALGTFLEENNIVGICDIDTRKLTRIIRENGAMNGMIITADTIDTDAVLRELAEFKATPPTRFTVQEEYKAGGARHNVAVLNLGAKQSLIAALTARGCNVTVLPSDCTDFSKYDGLVISDGAKNPADYLDILPAVKSAMDKMPTVGIGMGHIVMAMAMGMQTTKLHYGHRGANQPVASLLNDRTYITSQNHGYIVADANTTCDVTYKNANDKSIEGLKYKDMPAFSVQFTPDSTLSMVSTSFIYDDFIKMMEIGK